MQFARPFVSYIVLSLCVCVCVSLFMFRFCLFMHWFILTVRYVCMSCVIFVRTFVFFVLFALTQEKQQQRASWIGCVRPTLGWGTPQVSPFSVKGDTWGVHQPKAKETTTTTWDLNTLFSPEVGVVNSKCQPFTWKADTWGFYVLISLIELIVFARAGVNYPPSVALQREVLHLGGSSPQLAPCRQKPYTWGVPKKLPPKCSTSRWSATLGG